MSTPRLFIMRHGETEWSANGRHTSVTDLPLTENGEKHIRATGRAMVGNDRLVVPSKLAHIYVSPRKRAQRTFELLHIDHVGPLPWQLHGACVPGARRSGACSARIEVTEAVREWDYGAYEGITTHAIRAQRKETGADLSGSWDIWKDGCPGGEGPADITARLDALIAEIREKYHGPALQAAAAAADAAAAAEVDAGSADLLSPDAGDVLIVAHGHILRALAKRWVGATMETGPLFLLETGGIGVLSYDHNNINEPAILLGSTFPVNADEQERS